MCKMLGTLRSSYHITAHSYACLLDSDGDLIFIFSGFCWWNVALLCAWLGRNVGISALRKDNTHRLFRIELKQEVGVLRH